MHEHFFEHGMYHIHKSCTTVAKLTAQKAVLSATVSHIKQQDHNRPKHTLLHDSGFHSLALHGA